MASDEELVKLPGGNQVPRSMVHRVPKGMRLHMQEDGEVVGIDKDGNVHNFDPPSPAAQTWMNDPNYPERRQFALAKKLDDK